MTFIAILYALAVVVAMVAIIRAKARQSFLKDESQKSFIVRMPQGLLPIALIGFLLFAALLFQALLAPDQQAPADLQQAILVYGGGTLLMLLFWGVSMATARWELLVGPDDIIYTPAFGRRASIVPNDIAYVVQLGNISAYDAAHRKHFTARKGCSNFDRLEKWMWEHNVKFGRGVSDAEALLYRLRHLGQKRERRLVPSPAQTRKAHLQQQREVAQTYIDRRRQLESMPPDLPENLAEILESFVRTTLDLKIGQAGPLAVGCSKFGGRPDLPRDFAWDYYEGKSYDGIVASRPLAFLLQINCAEVKAQCGASLLPDTGLLSFFYELDTMEWGPDTGDKGYVNVHYFDCPMEDLAPCSLPEGLRADYNIPETAISISKGISLPDYGLFSRLLSLESDYANGPIYEQAVLDAGIPSPGRAVTAVNAQMFGYPSSIQNDVFDEFLMAWLQENEEAAPGTGEEAELDWQLLLQLDSELFEKLGTPGIMFGDSGLIYFGIRSEDLARRDFEKTWFTLQCF